MCLAVIVKIIEIFGDTAEAEMNGLKVKVNISLLEGIEPGDYAIVHTGFAIQKYDKKEAEETLALIREAVEHAGL